MLPRRFEVSPRGRRPLKPLSRNLSVECGAHLWKKLITLKGAPVSRSCHSTPRSTAYGLYDTCRQLYSLPISPRSWGICERSMSHTSRHSFAIVDPLSACVPTSHFGLEKLTPKHALCALQTWHIVKRISRRTPGVWTSHGERPRVPKSERCRGGANIPSRYNHFTNFIYRYVWILGPS